MRRLLAMLLAGGMACAADGRYPDVATTDRDGIWIFRGSAQGDYAGGTFHFIGASVEPWHICVADLNGDALPDLVSSNRLGPSVSVFLNTGDAFEGPFDYFGGGEPYAAAAGDFDSDGDLDLAVANPEASGALVLLENQGGGTFAQMAVLTPGNATYAVECADVDANGTTDLVVVNDDSEDLVVLLGNGAGAFVESGRYATERSPKSLALGRFNGDALPDVAVINYDSATVSSYVNTGGGTFEYVASYAVGVLPRHAVARDFDGDGTDDLVVACGRGSEEVAVLFGLGGGRFAPAEAYYTGPRPNAVAVADADADGRLDIFAANWSLDAEQFACVSLLGNAGGRQFAKRLDFKPAAGFPKLTFVAAGYFTASLFIRGDANGDGRVNLSDAIRSLYYVFGLSQVACADAVDANDDGAADIADPIYVLEYLFGSGPPPAPPFPRPGADPTPDNLTCR
ncbi:MAG TPA: hypothetical protein DCM87_17130 [Planctomycetes bacterium]|nr:hypothetical protein [Planctomycetota bacterium]